MVMSTVRVSFLIGTHLIKPLLAPAAPGAAAAVFAPTCTGSNTAIRAATATIQGPKEEAPRTGPAIVLIYIRSGLAS